MSNYIDFGYILVIKSSCGVYPSNSPNINRGMN